MSIVAFLLILIGCLVFGAAALGLVRYPDPYTRASAVGTAAGIGIALVLIGALILQFSWWNLFIVALAVVVQFLTSAIGTMVIARSAYLIGAPITKLAYNELADDTDDHQAS